MYKIFRIIFKNSMIEQRKEIVGNIKCVNMLIYEHDWKEKALDVQKYNKKDK